MGSDYAIGTQYMSRDKHPKLCTVVDVLKTFNSKGELVATRYVSTHQFCGNPITDSNVVAVTIARGLIAEAAVSA